MRCERYPRYPLAAAVRTYSGYIQWSGVARSSSRVEAWRKRGRNIAGNGLGFFTNSRSHDLFLTVLQNATRVPPSLSVLPSAFLHLGFPLSCVLYSVMNSSVLISIQRMHTKIYGLDSASSTAPMNLTLRRSLGSFSGFGKL